VPLSFALFVSTLASCESSKHTVPYVGMACICIARAPGADKTSTTSASNCHDRALCACCPVVRKSIELRYDEANTYRAGRETLQELHRLRMRRSDFRWYLKFA
jgi:hypothetical protein